MVYWLGAAAAYANEAHNNGFSRSVRTIMFPKLVSLRRRDGQGGNQLREGYGSQLLFVDYLVLYKNG